MRISNPCIRCGKERVVVRIWKERIAGSPVTNIETKCPDPECQKKVDTDNRKYHEQNEKNRVRAQNRLKNLHPAKKKT